MKKNSVVVVCHNRYKNLEYWTSIISACDKSDTEFTIIHNCDVPDAATQMRVMQAGGRYLPRPNVGMDVGAFQDVCRRRLFGFNYDYEFLLWFTDDCLPMNPHFVEQYVQHFSRSPDTSVVCLEISNQIKRHIRTTGFCLRREFAEKLVFAVDPVVTKEHCYQFEHRGPHTLLEQAQSVGKAVQLSSLRLAPVWDSGGGGHGWINRREEFEKNWRNVLSKVPGTPWAVFSSSVAVISPAFERYPSLVASLIAQTYPSWNLYLVHDGPAPNDYPKFSDSRIHFIEEGGPRKNYGHPIREQYLQKVRTGEIQADFVLVTNDDNYHVPFFLEKLVKSLEERPHATGALCSHMVHNYAGFPGQPLPAGKEHHLSGYNIIQCRPERGFIDVAGVLIRSEFAGKTGWPDYSHSSDWNYLNRVAMLSGGWEKFINVPGCLLVHN